jgi:O-antigen ligase
MIAENSPVSWIYRVLFFLLAAFPIIPLKIMPLVIGAWCILSPLFFSAELLHHKKKRILLLLFIAPYFLYLISLLYDPDRAAALYLLERKLCILLIPFCFFFSARRLRENDIKIFFAVFISAAFLEAVWVNLAILLTKGSLDHGPENDLSYAYRRAYEGFSRIHPTYMAVMLFFAGFLNIHRFLTEDKMTVAIKISRIIVTFVLLLCGILLGARTPFFAFIITLFIYVSFRFRSLKKILGFISVFLLVSFLIILFTPVFKIRLAEFDHFKIQPALGYDVNSAHIRVGIYDCAFSLLKDGWVKGYGAGGLQQELNRCYDSYPAYIYKVKKFNTHNEFLNVWLSLGITGFILFLASLAFPFVFAIREHHIVYACFLIFFCICCLTENNLSRQMGVVFFTLFNSLFAFLPVTSGESVLSSKQRNLL